HEIELPVELRQGQAHDRRAHEDVRGRRPFDVPATNQELFVNRLEQIEIEIAAAHEIGELVAVFQKQGLDQPLEREVAADKKELLRLRPRGHDGGLGKDDPVEREQDAEQ